VPGLTTRVTERQHTDAVWKQDLSLTQEDDRLRRQMLHLKEVAVFFDNIAVETSLKAIETELINKFPKVN